MGREKKTEDVEERETEDPQVKRVWALEDRKAYHSPQNSEAKIDEKIPLN